MSLNKLLNDVQIAAVVCNQWGDTGKGKVVDFFAEWADIIARGTGGNNAGHTFFVDGKEKITHLIPSGIVYDSAGKINLLGNGMVIDISVLCHELDDLDQEGLTYQNLVISKDAHVIMPYQIARDQARNLSQTGGGIGSTGRGIGPCYTDKIARRGVRIGDLFNLDKLAKGIQKAQQFYPEQNIMVDEVIEYLKPFAERIQPFIRDTVTLMHEQIREGKRVLLEGAQGLLLSIEHGTYPYVTSSDCSVSGTATGVGISAGAVDLCLGVVKFPFMTRVGAGPFPTELGGAASEEYCAAGLEHDVFFEAKEYLGMNLNLRRIRQLQSEGNSAEISKTKRSVQDFIKLYSDKVLDLINSDDPFLQGVGIRLAAAEYGATTARPRRTGWTDAVAARYAVGINGPNFVLTKPDCLDGINEFQICYGYDDGFDTFSSFNKDSGFLRSIKPECVTYIGYSDIREVRDYAKLPESLQRAISDFERFTGGIARVISVGPEREQTIIRE